MWLQQLYYVPLCISWRGCYCTFWSYWYVISIKFFWFGDKYTVQVSHGSLLFLNYMQAWNVTALRTRGPSGRRDVYFKFQVYMDCSTLSSICKMLQDEIDERSYLAFAIFVVRFMLIWASQSKTTVYCWVHVIHLEWEHRTTDEIG